MKNIPVITIHKNTLAEAYEECLIQVYKNGIKIKTQYDKIGDPLSLDATVNVTIENPMEDPMIHKAFPGGIEDLKEYTMELEGAKDHWVKNLNDPKDTRWLYTYHGRMSHWGEWRINDISEDCSCQYTHIMHGGKGKVECEHSKLVSTVTGIANVDQIEGVIDKLCKQPFTRQANMITWMPNLDLNSYDPPCLQSWFGRILEDEDGKTWWLNYNMRIRSNDLVGATYMNWFGLTMFTKNIIADEISKRTGKCVKLARMNWQADSMHVYGKDIKSLEERVINRLSTTSFSDRVYNFYDPMIQEIYNGAEESIKEKIKIETKKML